GSSTARHRAGTEARGADALLRGRSLRGVFPAGRASTGWGVVGGLKMDGTVDGIAESVRSLLTSPEGEKRVAGFNRLFADVDKSTPTLKEIRAKLHQRAGMQLYINVSDARKVSDAVRMSVRVHGCTCGTLVANSKGQRTFSPSNERLFQRYGYNKVQGVAWRDPRVAKFVKACPDAIGRKDVKTGRPEASAEAALIGRMKLESGGW